MFKKMSLAALFVALAPQAHSVTFDAYKDLLEEALVCKSAPDPIFHREFLKKNGLIGKGTGNLYPISGGSQSVLGLHASHLILDGNKDSGFVIVGMHVSEDKATADKLMKSKGGKVVKEDGKLGIHIDYDVKAKRTVVWCGVISD